MGIIIGILGIGVAVYLYFLQKKGELPSNISNKNFVKDFPFPPESYKTEGESKIVEQTVIKPYEKLIFQYANLFNLSPIYVISVIYKESSGNPTIGGGIGEVGLMQISPIALADYNERNSTNIQRNDLKNPEINIKIGCYTLSRLLKRIESFDMVGRVNLIDLKENIPLNYIINDKYFHTYRAYNVGETKIISQFREHLQAGVANANKVIQIAWAYIRYLETRK